MTPSAPVETTRMIATERTILSDSYRDLVDRHQDMVFAVCRRILRNDQDASDAAQETFLRLWQRGDQIHTNPGAWLHACARSVSLNFMRSSTRRHRHERAVGEDPERPNPGADLEDDETRRVIDDCLAELAEHERELVITYFHGGLSFSQIGKREGVSKVAIKKRLDKILERLRIRLKNRLGVVPTALLFGAFAARAHGAGAPAGLSAQLHAIPSGGIATTSAATGGVVSAHSLVLASAAALGLAAWFTPATGDPVIDGRRLAPLSETSEVSGEAGILDAGRDEVETTTIEVSSTDGSLSLRIEAQGPVRFIDSSPSRPAQAVDQPERVAVWRECPLTGKLYRASVPVDLADELSTPVGAETLIEADRHAAGAVDSGEVAGLPTATDHGL